MKSFTPLLGLVVACSASPTEPSPREDIATLDAFCGVFAETICASFDDPECRDEVGSDCVRNATTRNPGGYTAAGGAACLAELEQVDFADPPLHCNNLSIAACDDYLDERSSDPCE